MSVLSKAFFLRKRTSRRISHTASDQALCVASHLLLLRKLASLRWNVCRATPPRRTENSRGSRSRPCLPVHQAHVRRRGSKAAADASPASGSQKALHQAPTIFLMHLHLVAAPPPPSPLLAMFAPYCLRSPLSFSLPRSLLRGRPPPHIQHGLRTIPSRVTVPRFVRHMLSSRHITHPPAHPPPPLGSRWRGTCFSPPPPSPKRCRFCH